MTTDIFEDSENLELFHYGIKGMKWGVRRKEGSDGTVGSSNRAAKKAQREEKRETKRAAKQKEAEENWKKPTSEDARKAGENRTRVGKHGTDSLSNKELQGLVNRMNLEQQYTNLKDSGKSASARKAGQEYVSDIQKDAGKDLATEALKWAAGEAVKYAFGKATSGGGSSASNVYRVATNQIAPSRKRIGR